MQRNLDRNTWDRVLGKIESRVNAHSFSTWFRPTHYVDEDAARLKVRVPNTWFAEWLRTNYLPLIEDALREIERPGLCVEFVPERVDGASRQTVAQTLGRAPSREAGRPAAAPPRRRTTRCPAG